MFRNFCRIKSFARPLYKPRCISSIVYIKNYSKSLQIHQPLNERLHLFRGGPCFCVRHYTSNSSKDDTNNVMTKRQENRSRLTRILREYGPVAIVFHTTMSLSVLGVCYMIVKSGIDVENFLKYFKIDSSRYSTASTFAVSYIIYKILLPIRVTITVTCVPLIVRSLRARGWMKTPPKTPPTTPPTSQPPNSS